MGKNMFKGRLQKQLISQSHDSENKLKEGAMGPKKISVGVKQGELEDEMQFSERTLSNWTGNKFRIENQSELSQTRITFEQNGRCSANWSSDIFQIGLPNVKVVITNSGYGLKDVLKNHCLWLWTMGKEEVKGQVLGSCMEPVIQMNSAF